MASRALRPPPPDTAPQPPKFTLRRAVGGLRAGAAWATTSPIVYLLALAALQTQAIIVYKLFWPVWLPALIILALLLVMLRRPTGLPTVLFFCLAVTLLTILPAVVAIQDRFQYGISWVNHDGAIQTEEAITRILQGQPIYGIDWSHTSMAQVPWLDLTKGPTNPALHHYAYLPLTPLIGIPVKLLTNLFGWPFDYRMALLPFIPIGLAGIWWLPIDRLRRLLLAATIYLNPFLMVYLWYGQNDMVFVAMLFIGLALLARNRPVLASLAIGFAVAFKPFALPAVPFLMAILWLRWRRQHQAREPVLALLALAAIPVLTVVPFLLADPAAFYRDTVLYSNGGLPDSYPIGGIGFGHLLLALHLVGLRSAFPFGLLELLAVALVLGFTLPRFLRRPSIGAWLFGYTAALFAIGFFARHYENSHNGVVLTLLAGCLPLIGSPELAPRLEVMPRVASRWRTWLRSASTWFSVAWLRLTAPLAAYLALAGLLFAGAWRAPSTLAVGNTVDTSLQMWFLGWTPFALSHGHNPLLTTYLDSSVGVNLMWNTAMPLLGVLVWPVTATLGPVVAYNALETAALALSAWCAFLVYRRYVGNTLAAAVGGLLFGFSPYMLAHSLGHPQLTALFIPPLIWLTLDEILVRRRWSPILMGVVLGLLGAAQLLIEEEVFAMVVLFGLAGLLLLLVLARDEARDWRRAIRAGVATALTFTVVAAFPLAIQLFGPQRLPLGSTVRMPNSFQTDLLNFIMPSHLNALAPAWVFGISRYFPGGPTEAAAYLGIHLIALLVVTTARFSSMRPVRFAAALGVLVALLSLGPLLRVGGWGTFIPAAVLAIPLPALRRFLPSRFLAGAFLAGWSLLLVAPLLHNILPSRLAWCLFLMAGLLLAVFVDAAIRLPTPRRRLAGLGVVVLVLLPLLPRWPYPSIPQPIPSFFTSAAVTQIADGSVALIAPFATRDDATAMRWQAASGMRFRMPEGYAFVPQQRVKSQNPPPSTIQDVMIAIEDGERTAAITSAERQQMNAELTDWRVESIVVGPMANQDTMVALFQSLLGQGPVTVGGVFLWTNVPAALE